MPVSLLVINCIAGFVFTTALTAVLLYLPWQIRQSYRQTFVALAQAVEVREPHLLGHAEQTARYVILMARWCGMSLMATRRLEYAALLHGIGKVSVPYGMLNTSACLPGSADRFVLRDYVRVGGAIMDAIPILRPAADYVRYHHEYMDGSGYPYGRYGRSIPFEAQMLCVASEYVAMTTPRLYRVTLALPAAEADAYLWKHAGSRYRRSVVLLFQIAKAGEKLKGALSLLVRRVTVVIQSAPLPRRVL